MSENIIIQENGVAKTVTVDKLNIKRTESGTCNWVPEDDFKVGTLKVWRNGTFKASDFGVYGFDKVIVVSGSRGGDAAKLHGDKHLGEIHPEALAIKEGGKAVKLYDVHHISVNKTDSSRLSMMSEPLLIVDDISINKTGTYSAYDYDKYGFDEVTVDISSSGGGGGGGSTTKPDEIRITKQPNKVEYFEGDTIDITGMVVTAYLDGRVWSNDDYPRGIVPLREVTINPTIAHAAPEPSGDYVYSAWYEDIPRNDGVAQLFVIDGHMITVQYGKNQTNPNALVWLDGNFYNECYTHYPFEPYGQGTPNFRYRQRIGDSTYYLGFMSTHDPDNCYFYGLVAFQGEVPGGSTGGDIAVNWQRPGDGHVLTTSYEITITEADQNQEGEGQS